MAELSNKTKPFRELIIFYVFVNICFVLCISLSSYVHIPLSGFKDHLMYLLHLVLLQTTVSGFIYLLSLNKWVFRIVFNALFFVLAIFSFWVYTQDISITKSLVHTVLETKLSFGLDLISLPFLIYLVVVIAILIIINIKYNKLPSKKFNIVFFVISCLCISLLFIAEEKRTNTLKSRIPYSVFTGFWNYFQEDELVLQNLTSRLSSNNKGLNIVFVLGESVRADHLYLNGYKRNTTPKLALEENVVSFKNITTPYTYTLASLPRILTNLSVDNQYLEDPVSLYDVFNKTDYATTWIGNQELESRFENIVRSNNKVVVIDSLRSVFSFNKALDKELLNPLFSTSNHVKGNLTTLHMMGSHWYYENRYTDAFRVFKPVIDSKYIPSLEPEEIINSYDNTILYLDSFMDLIIKDLEEKKEPSLVIYLADHGEILGEGGKWLHAQKSSASQNPAMFVWYSSEFRLMYPGKVDALKRNKNKRFTTDFLFHSLLDVIEVNGFPYQKNESIFQ